MQLICPQCKFARELEGSAVPDRPVQVTCPRCSATFRFDPQAAESGIGEPPAEPLQGDSSPAKTRGETGGNDSQTEKGRHQDVPPASAAAGFWIRAVAAVLDSLISSALQFVMVFALSSITELSGAASLPMVQMLIMLCSTLAGVFYYVFFTGYSGQTPGKMALRIRVVRLDDTQVSYGQAFIRETIGKFISGIVLGIGYLMVALRSDKRGLHDLMADTRVIKI